MVGKIVVFTFFILFGLLYLHNVTIDIFGGDTGDLVTAALVGGVAHPPGYPLFLILGRILGSLPLPLLPVTKVALVSIFSSLISLYLIYRIVSLFDKNLYFRLLTPAVIGLTYLFWLYAEVPEVFALNMALSLGVIFSSLKFEKTLLLRYLLIGSFLFGLGLSNHHTIVFTLPFCIAALLRSRKKLLFFGPKLLLVPLIGIMGLLPYGYLLYASSTNPSVNWNHIDSFGLLLHHFLRSDYGTFSAGAFQQPINGAKLVILKTYLDTMVRTVTIPVVVASLIGVAWGLKKQKNFAVPGILTFFISGPFFIAYSGFPIIDYFVQGLSERFYIFSFTILMLFFPFGLRALYAFFINTFSKKMYAQVLIGVFILIPILLFIANHKRTDFSRTQLGTNFAKQYLQSLPNDSVFIVSGDTRSFNTWYVYYILGVRPDIHLIQHGEFALKNPLLEREKDKIKSQSEMSGADLFLNAVLALSKDRPVYSSIKFKIPEKNYQWIPIGLGFRLYEKNKIPTRDEYAKLVQDSIKGLTIPYVNTLTSVEQNLISRSIPSYYSTAMSLIGDTYFTVYTDIGSAKRYYNFSKFIDPTDLTGYLGLSKVALISSECQSAETNAKKAIELVPIAFEGYVLWYRSAAECYKSKERVMQVENTFRRKFNSSPEELQKLLKKY